MARHPKTGLDYYPKDVDIWDDFKIMDLMEHYGGVGYAVYDVAVCMVYKNGYYLQASMEQLCALIQRKVGNRWINDKREVEEILRHCGEIGLFDKELLAHGVITSVGIQRRYAEVTARNRVDKSNYWLLKNDTSAASELSQPNSARKLKDEPAAEAPSNKEADIQTPAAAFKPEPAAASPSNKEAAIAKAVPTPTAESVAETPVSAAKTPVSVTEIPVSAAEMTPNKRKEKKKKEKKMTGKESVCVQKLPCTDGELIISPELLSQYTHLSRHECGGFSQEAEKLPHSQPHQARNGQTYPRVS